MRLILLALCVAALGGCNAGRVAEDGRQKPVAGRRLAEAQNDSLVRAALGDRGAHLEYRWVVGIDSVRPQEVKSVFDPAMHRWLVLDDTVFLDLSGVDRVEVSHGSGTSGVMVYLNPTSAERLRSSTGGHLGTHLSIVLNGRLVMAPAPIIRTPFSDYMTVVAGIDSTVARELAARLRDGLPHTGQQGDAKQQ